MSPLVGHVHLFHGPDFIYLFLKHILWFLLSRWDVLADVLPENDTFCCTGTAEEEPPAEETDAQPVKRAAEEEEVGWHQA